MNSLVSGNGKILLNAIKYALKDKLAKNAVNNVNFTMRAMVIGVPNSGKSTIVNNLCAKAKAVTGNRAGVTKNKQWVRVDKDIEIMDTPGVLLPSFEDEAVAYNLAIVGSIKDEIISPVEIATKLIRILSMSHSNVWSIRYGINVDMGAQSIDVLKQIGTKRGCIMKGGEIDMERAAKIVLTDFRSGKLGKICLEEQND